MGESETPLPELVTPVRPSMASHYLNSNADDASDDGVGRQRGVGNSKNKRPNHMMQLLDYRLASMELMEKKIKSETKSTSRSIPSVGTMETTTTLAHQLSEEQKKRIVEQSAFLQNAHKTFEEMENSFPTTYNHLEIRMSDLTYKVKVDPSTQNIRTVYNQSPFHLMHQWFSRVSKGEKRPERTEMIVLDRINLVFKPSKMYLILGSPGSGKTSLLKAIAGRLNKREGNSITGTVLYNELPLQKRKDLYIENCINFVDQLDFHAPRLTVRETLDFAFQCKSGGTHAPPSTALTREAKALIKRLDKENQQVNLTMQGLGLDHVADTFVGDSQVRGVSGGQRRRVTFGEMITSPAPILCGDEISTGLDAASTYDICRSSMHYCRATNSVRIFSLLQPSPETVSMFDEIILLSQGMVLYAGPIREVEKYFSDLGYVSPETTDLADFLQVLTTIEGGKMYFSGTEQRETPYSIPELADKFRDSSQFASIMDAKSKPWQVSWVDAEGKGMTVFARSKVKFQSTPLRSTYLNLKRFIMIWQRDRRFLIANAMKNVIMGISVGGVFFQTDNFISVFGVCFQTLLFIMLGAMVSAPGQISDRLIYYKHSDSNFFDAFPYVIGRTISMIPQSFTDVLIFGSIIYWMVGLVPEVQNYCIFIAVLFSFAVVMNQQLSIFGAVARTKSTVQAASACILLFLILFCGFIVSPNIIPSYWIWVYWWNPLAWAYRAMILNEFLSPEYQTVEAGSDYNEGQLILISQGFVLNDEPFGAEWIGWTFGYLALYSVFCMILTAVGLRFVRVNTEPPRENKDSAIDENGSASLAIDVPIKPVTMTFTNICFDVKSSKGKETLRLLHKVSGIFEPGRMCALMGSSGAGKTTLMDVIAMRKSSGIVSGDIRINGFLQERKSFRRITGFVEQFDVQSPELTVRETILFAARLRLDSSEPMVETDKQKEAYVDSVLRSLELMPIADSLVGSDEAGGLSFEQRKRLSIAVELAASPSILFLDEPTSGLDSRAAKVVVTSLRRVADTGRTIIATIHQPSNAVFEMFDDLLLLRKGGHTVFFGELGKGCKNLVEYFEARKALPINRGENPANWMLKVITSETADVDYAEAFLESDNLKNMLAKVTDITNHPNEDEKIVFDSEFASSSRQRQLLINERLRTIYWRSPAYNLTRLLICAGIALILGSVFIKNRHPDTFSETEIQSLFSAIFISFIIIGVLSITSVLPVMLKIRDSYYRHRASGMYGSNAIAMGLGVAEKWFIVLSSAIFSVIFIAAAGLHFTTPRRDIAFWGFFTYNLAIYSYFGQAFMCLVRGMGTAQILASVFIGINNFFSGLIVRPQYLSGLFAFTYWICPGHYVYEGMIVGIFNNDERTVFASRNSDFYEYLGCNETTAVCSGTVHQFVDSFFGGKFNRNHFVPNILILGGILILARAVTFLALKYFRYTST